MFPPTCPEKSDFQSPLLKDPEDLIPAIHSPDVGFIHNETHNVNRVFRYYGKFPEKRPHSSTYAYICLHFPAIPAQTRPKTTFFVPKVRKNYREDHPRPAPVIKIFALPRRYHQSEQKMNIPPPARIVKPVEGPAGHRQARKACPPKISLIPIKAS